MAILCEHINRERRISVLDLKLHIQEIDFNL